MEALESQIIRETNDEEIAAAISGTKRYNPGLKALLNIKKNTATLEITFNELLQTEIELHELNKNGMQIIEARTSPEHTFRWNTVSQEVNKALIRINYILTSAKEKIAQKDKNGYPELWNQLALHIQELKESSKNAAESGLAILPVTNSALWEEEFVKPQKTLVDSLVSQVDSCCILVQIIERYTPEELDSLTRIIVDHIPLDFTYEEAKEYEKDYYKALINFRNEFKKDKNLWDKFLDILAGGTHQLPSEGAMMERWLDGEEAEPSKV